MAQSPLISIPRKHTDDVDWTSPIRAVISQSYSESPESYAAECALLQRCRQDAVRGAGSDLTARDLLYKYFGQLELLELRFAEIKVTFPWADAFTGKLTTQTSIAYEKASVLFQIAGTHSAIAASQSRADTEGTKRAFYYFRTCAGMLTYINENFLHAPSTDLSREVVKFLASLITVQATEVFFEKCVEEKKASALVAKIAAQAAAGYTSLSEEVKDFMGKGILDRSWVSIIQVCHVVYPVHSHLIALQIKSKYFSALANHHRALADSASSQHAPALARHTLSASLAKEASRLATAFTPSSASLLGSTSSFLSAPLTSPASGTPANSNATLPPDAALSIQALTRTLASLTSTALATAQRENELIYHTPPPSQDTLAALPPLPLLESMTSLTAPIPIHEVFAQPTVQATIGPDIFARLVPLSVHESASVYSEEKAKLTRAEVERGERAELEVGKALERLAVRRGVRRYKTMLEGRNEDEAEEEGGSGIPEEVLQWRHQLLALPPPASEIPARLAELGQRREAIQQTLSTGTRALEIESRDCEAARVAHASFAQEPSAGHSREIRGELKAHGEALGEAGGADARVAALWGGVKPGVEVLTGKLEALERYLVRPPPPAAASDASLLDLQDGVGNNVLSPQEQAEEAEARDRLEVLVRDVDSQLARLEGVGREREEGLRILKEKIQSDDVSHLLLLNRRNTAVEPALFAAELEKFRPDQQRLAALLPLQQSILGELGAAWRRLQDAAAGKDSSNVVLAKWVRRWEEKQSKREAAVRRRSHVIGELRQAYEGYNEVREGLGKGLSFYKELGEIVGRLEGEVRDFVAKRTVEREGMLRRLEAAQGGPKLPAAAPARPPPPPAKPANLDSALAGLSLNGPASPPAQQHQSPHQNYPWQNSPPPLPPAQPQHQSSYGGYALPAPPSQHQQSSQYSLSTPPPNTHQQPKYQSPPPPPVQSVYQHSPQHHQVPPPPQPYQSPYQQTPPPPPPPHHSYQHQRQSSSSLGTGSFLPPPPPQPVQSSFSPPPPPSSSAPLDPYASLGMFNPGAGATPPAVPQQQQYGQQPSYQQPPRQEPYLAQGFPPPPPQQYQYGTLPPPPQQQQQGGYQYGSGY
ncbi:hypothetical protein DXG03_000715 [Asterophora parasitica]|uniref:BRO domain-containing protein 1 n=1 Tax=Asterophora parasitica TaxID=117018 RepID=A0A9P7G4R4_9AGAR|nr:hypothetical protein DXG03_000715 [Asterophora parasitica]